jgi:cell division protein FtsW
VLILATWGIMFFMAGLPWLWIAALGGAAAGGVLAAYTVFPHVSGRIDRFLTGEGDTFQVDMGREALLRGGWLGQGPGEGTIKRILPDSHTDFVFAVAGEEFGLIVCLIIMGIFAFVVLRGLSSALKEHDDFTRYAIAGLVTQFGLQSVINMGVNLQLLPAKGMTLPFISYGGSSLVAMAISMGMVLALTRRDPLKRMTIGRTPLGRPIEAG